MALTTIQQVRLLVQDTDPALPFASEDEIQFFLDRNNQSVNRAALEVAKVILLQLSLRSGSETVDIFSLSGGNKSAEQYRLALQLFLRDPNMNPVYQTVNGYAGGVSKSDMQSNVLDCDNNSILTPLTPLTESTSTFGV